MQAPSVAELKVCPTDATRDMCNRPSNSKAHELEVCPLEALVLVAHRGGGWHRPQNVNPIPDQRGSRIREGVTGDLAGAPARRASASRHTTHVVAPERRAQPQLPSRVFVLAERRAAVLDLVRDRNGPCQNNERGPGVVVLAEVGAEVEERTHHREYRDQVRQQ